MLEKEKRKQVDRKYNRFVDWDVTIVKEDDITIAPENESKTVRQMFEEMIDFVEEGKNWREPLKGDVPDHIKKYHKELLDLEKIEQEEGIIFD